MRTKLYLWLNNSSESDFTDKPNIIMPNGSNAHSGGVVVLAESIDEAAELTQKHLGYDPRKCGIDSEMDVEVNTSPIVIDLDKKGVVFHGNGDC